jgi:hypothetical protein
MQQHEKATDTTASPPDAQYAGEAGRASSVSLDKDEAIGLVGEHAHEIDPVVEAKVLKKIDWFLIPAMIVGMILFSGPLYKF